MTDEPTTKAAAEPERVSIHVRLAQDELDILERSAAAGTPSRLLKKPFVRL
jgi:hypothetical protein